MDKEWASSDHNQWESLKKDYRRILARGADVIETDIPRELGQRLHDQNKLPSQHAKFFSMR